MHCNLCFSILGRGCVDFEVFEHSFDKSGIQLVGKGSLETWSTEFNDGVIRAPNQNLSIDQTLCYSRQGIDRDGLRDFLGDFYKLDVLGAAQRAKDGVNTLNPVVFRDVHWA